MVERTSAKAVGAADGQDEREEKKRNREKRDDHVSKIPAHCLIFVNSKQKEKELKKLKRHNAAVLHVYSRDGINATEFVSCSADHIVRSKLPFELGL